MKEKESHLCRRSKQLCAVVALFVVMKIYCRHVDQQDLSGNGMNLRSNDHSNNETYQKFGFFLMGDTPYAAWEEAMLREQVAAMNRERKGYHRFAVHVGDIQKVKRTKCEETQYRTMAEIFASSDLPLLVTPGDNDWYDCPNQTVGWSYFDQYMLHPSLAFHQDLLIHRSLQYPELFTMYMEGILFISVHLIDRKNEEDETLQAFNDRTNRNLVWIQQVLEDPFKSKTPPRAVVIFGHSLRSPRTRPFFEQLATHFINKAAREEAVVLYLHGDGHDWQLDTKLSHQLGWKNYYDIQVDQGAFADPLIIDVARQVNGRHTPLRQERDDQILLAKGLFRIDRQRGRYSNEFLKDWMSRYNGVRDDNDDDQEQ
jgi:hypothetical protein